jgi:hypothetical protein
MARNAMRSECSMGRRFARPWKRRDLRMTKAQATWSDAAIAARREGLSRAEQQALKRERRSPLPSETPLH